MLKHQGEPIATPEQIFDCENNIEPPRTIAERIAEKYGAAPTFPIVDDIANAIEDAREVGEKRKQAYIDVLIDQLRAEGEHTAAANANIDRLNTEIERVTRRRERPWLPSARHGRGTIHARSMRARRHCIPPQAKWRDHR